LAHTGDTKAIIEAMAALGTEAGLRARKKERTLEAIVTAAIDLFEKKGFDATTVEEIAAAADISPRTFFRYFDSKVDVAMGPKSDNDDFSQRFHARPPDEPPVEAMRQVFRTELATMAAESPLFARQLRVMLGTPSLRALAREHFNEHEHDMVVLFAQRLKVPEDDLGAQVMATALANAIWTVTTRWAEEDAAPERLVEMIDEACALLTAGFH
jgi:AcrR family transcriptional regulator